MNFDIGDVLTVLSILLYAAGSASSLLGTLCVENGGGHLPFRDLFQDGLDYFWRALGVILLPGGWVAIMFLLLFGCMMSFGVATMGLEMICLQPLLL